MRTARHPVSLSWRGVTALFTYDVPHYRARGCGFGKFQRRAYTCGKSDRVADRGEENFHTSEGDIRFRERAAVGFFGVGTFLPFILELNGFSRSS